MLRENVSLEVAVLGEPEGDVNFNVSRIPLIITFHPWPDFSPWDTASSKKISISVRSN